MVKLDTKSIPRQFLRFKLSSLSLLTLAAAVVCLEARWQFEQRCFERAAKSLNARVDYQQRPTATYAWSWLVLSPQRNYISGLHIEAYRLDAPLFASNVVSEVELRSLFSLPAAKDLGNLHLSGTTVDDEFLRFFAERSQPLQVSLEFTSVTAESAKRLAEILPNCSVSYGVSNGPDFARLAHAEQYALANSIEDFALAREGDSDAVERLLRINCHDNSQYQETIVKSLRDASSPDCQAVLQRALTSAQPHVRGNAIAVLANQGHEAALYRGLDDPDVSVRSVSVRSVSVRSVSVRFVGTQDSDQAIDLLRKALADSDTSVRRLVITALAQRKHASAASLLVSACQDAAPQVRVVAIRALVNVDSDAAHAALLKGLTDINPSVREASALSLREHADAATIKALTVAASDPSQAVRAAALAALANMTQAQVRQSASNEPDNEGSA